MARMIINNAARGELANEAEQRMLAYLLGFPPAGEMKLSEVKELAAYARTLVYNVCDDLEDGAKSDDD